MYLHREQAFTMADPPMTILNASVTALLETSSDGLRVVRLDHPVTRAPTMLARPPFIPVEISLLIMGIASALLAVPGIFCNILSIVIFSRVGKTTLSMALYKILALADSGLLLILTVNWTPVAWKVLTSPDWREYIKSISTALQYFNFVEEILKDFAVWMVVLVTFERYIKIYRPQLYSKCRPGFAKYSSIALLLYLTVFNTFVLLTAPLNPMFPDSNEYLQTSFYTADCLLNIVLPVSSTLFMTVRIIMAIKFARLSRSSGTSHEDVGIGRRNTAASRTLIIIAVVFLVCQIPVCFHLISESLCSKILPAICVLIPYTQAFALVFQGLNSTVNFFVFYYKTTKFRHAFLLLWHKHSSCIQLKFRGTPPTSTTSTPPLRMMPISGRRNKRSNRV